MSTPNQSNDRYPMGAGVTRQTRELLSDGWLRTPNLIMRYTLVKQTNSESDCEIYTLRSGTKLD